MPATPYTFYPGAFPNLVRTTAPSAMPYYADLADINGDGGLAEAVRIYWAFKSVTVTATANASFSNGQTLSFSDYCEFPGDTRSLWSYQVSGAIVASDLGATDPTLYVEPVYRVASAGNWIFDPLSGEATLFLTSSESAQISIDLALRRVSGRYRLYLDFSTARTQRNSTLPLYFNGVNFFMGPPNSGTSYQLGVVNVFGYLFDYVAEAYFGGPSSITPTLNSQSLSITASEWTF